MTIDNDETLQVYIEESLEHLSDIENDFLTIEAGGADIDEDLVNKVYRAAHSIKGGAGFMGLTNIKDLTHEMENILGKIRSREMIPNSEIVNILLMASDTLRDMINDVFTSNEIDISQHIQSLKMIAKGCPAENKNMTEPETIIEESMDTGSSQITTIFAGIKDDVDKAIQDGKNVYLVHVDLIDDIQMKDKALVEFFEEMEQTGSILDAKIDMDDIGMLDKNKLPDRFPFTVLFATIFKPEDIHLLFDVNAQNIFTVDENFNINPLIGTVDESDVSEITVSDEDITDIRADEIIAQPETVEHIRPQPGISEKKTAETPKSQPVKKATTDTSLRVHVSLLDSLMTLAGELVLSRNQLIQAVSSRDNRISEIASQRIDLITSELQEAIMLTRMQPIGNVFGKFPRVVRDLSKSLGKKVNLTLEGKEVELDKTIIEAISDPLTHLVRNSVDHGIERPEERRREGKDVTGKILLKAFHEAGQVNIEITDDGKGLDGKRLAASAVEKGLITDDQAALMSENEKVNLIMLPGFSTAEKVTDVSGRGVGMDVVKTNLEKLGGVVDIISTSGKGTSIRIKLPLTLAIIPSQIILVQGERYAIPQVNMEELLRIPAHQVKDKIEKVGDAEVVRLRGNLLPLIKLADVLEIEQMFSNPANGEMQPDRRQSIVDRRSKTNPVFNEALNDDEPSNNNEQKNKNLSKRNHEDRRYHSASALNIVVVSTGVMKYGMVVDGLNDSEEIVVKPMGRHLKQCKGYAGATIMGDGKVALILDVANIARMAGLTSVEGSDRAEELSREAHAAIRLKKDMQSLLVFRSSANEQFAVSLSQVERIEKIKKENIEMVGDTRVMQYRGGSLPLFSMDQTAQVKQLADMDDFLVIVLVVGGKEVGLLAIGPVDAMDVSVEIDTDTLKQVGIMGSAIIGDHTTLLVDVYDLVQTLHPEWFAKSETVKKDQGKAPTILYAEDSKFFRNQVKRFMEEQGYNVIAGEDGLIAWDLLQKHADQISLVVTDIEMPNLDGYGLAEKIKSNGRYAHIPIIAVTTLAGEEDVAKGKAAGIDEYQIKLDREKLMQSIESFTNRK